MQNNPQRGNHPVKDSCADCIEPALELSAKAERIAALKHFERAEFVYSANQGGTTENLTVGPYSGIRWFFVLRNNSAKSAEGRSLLY